jgi:hypothetical protein
VSHDDDGRLQTLFCPVCSSLPVLAGRGVTPWFCSNTKCDVLAWDPYSTLEENLMDATPVTIEEFAAKIEESDT